MRRLLIAALAVSALALLAGPAVAGDPPPVKGFASAKQVDSLEKRVAELEAARAAKPPCACGAACPCSATAAAKSQASTHSEEIITPGGGRLVVQVEDRPSAPVAGGEFHVSPDGTLNVRHADGTYRAVPGAPRQAPPQATSAPVICGPSGCYSPAAWSVPAYLPALGTSGGSCPGGRCPLPR